VPFGKAIEEIEALELREGPKRKLLFENAVRAYKLEAWV
jgi:predicted TIM-barrel fold metal-dependent hydrolase